MLQLCDFTLRHAKGFLRVRAGLRLPKLIWDSSPPDLDWDWSNVRDATRRLPMKGLAFCDPNTKANSPCSCTQLVSTFGISISLGKGRLFFRSLATFGPSFAKKSCHYLALRLDVLLRTANAEYTRISISNNLCASRKDVA